MPVAFGLMAAALVTLLSAVGVFSRPDRVFWDLYHRLSAGRRRPDPRILLVAVDKPSLDYFAAQGVLWPWPRDVWGYLVDLAAEAGARAVLFDIFFDDPGIDRLNSSGYHTDMYFAERLGGPFPTAIAADLSPDEPASKSVPTGLVWRGSPMPAHSMPGYGASLSHPRFQNAVMGLTNMTPDADGVIRCTPLAYAVGGRTLPTLALRGAQFLEGDGLTLPVLDRLGRMWLRYYGHGGREGVFPYLSAAALITGQYPPDSLRGRLLIVGGYAPGLLDYKPTPLASAEEPYPGFEILATVVSNVVRGDELALPRSAVMVLVTLTAGVLGVAAVGLLGVVWLQIAFLAAVTLAVPVAGWALFGVGWLMPVTSPLLACYGGVGAKLYASWQLEGRQKRQLRQLFSRYLDDSVIEELIDKPEELQMEGKQLKTTVLFADIVGFTSVSEKLTPPQTVQLLNDYYRVFVDVMLNRRGFLDKYIGDAVMVIFGAPVSDERMPESAARAVLEALASVDELSRQRAERGLPVVSMCIGVHTDYVVVGNIGHPRRMDYTAIGSGVNTASRLEGANRVLGTRNLASDDFLAGVPRSILRREIGRVLLKGLHQPITVFELMPGSDAGPWLDNWARGWSLWRTGDRMGAVELWQNMGKTRTGDQALQILIARLKPNIDKEGADDDLFVFTSK